MHHAKCLHAWVNKDQQAHSATESPACYQTPHEDFNANVVHKDDAIKQPEDYNHLATTYRVQSIISMPGLDMCRVMFTDTHTNICPDLLPCEQPPATSTIMLLCSTFKCHHEDGSNCEFCFMCSVVPSDSDCPTDTNEQHNTNLKMANTLLQAHLDEDTPHDNNHTNKTISMINRVMSAVSRPDTFFDAQSHGQTYHDALESLPVSSKHL